MAGTGPGQISSDGHQVLIDFSSTGLDAIRHGGLQNKERLPESNLQAACSFTWSRDINNQNTSETKDLSISKTFLPDKMGMQYTFLNLCLCAVFHPDGLLRRYATAST